jgi:hypothetical protein
MPSTDPDDQWIQTVAKGSKMDGSFLAEEKSLRDNQEKPFERKSNPAKGNKIATDSSSKGEGDVNTWFRKQFQKPKDIWHLTSTEIEE